MAGRASASLALRAVLSVVGKPSRKPFLKASPNPSTKPSGAVADSIRQGWVRAG